MPEPATDARAGVDLELRRLADRWRSLPLAAANAGLPAAHHLVQELADEVAHAEGREPVPVPDLGPAVVVDQLRVMAYDWLVAGLPAPDLADRLADLRRALA